MAKVCGVLAAVTAITIVGGIVFGVAGVALWIVALVYSIMALSRDWRGSSRFHEDPDSRFWSTDGKW